MEEHGRRCAAHRPLSHVAHGTARPPCSTRLHPTPNPPGTPAPRWTGAPCSAAPERSRPSFCKVVQLLGGLEHAGADDPMAHEEPEDGWRVDRAEATEEPVAEDVAAEGGAGGSERGKVGLTVELEEYVRQDVVWEDRLRGGAVGSGPDRRQRGPRGGRQRLQV
jgi:hypothetical protein